MDREGGKKERMRKCREWIFLHFIFIFSFSLHLLAARLAGCFNFCNPGSIYLFILSIRTLRSEFATSKGSLLRVVFQFQLAPCSQLDALLAEAELTKLLCGEYNHMRTESGLFCNPVICRPNPLPNFVKLHEKWPSKFVLSNFLSFSISHSLPSTWPGEWRGPLRARRSQSWFAPERA